MERKAQKLVIKREKQGELVQAYASEGAMPVRKPEDVYRARAVSTIQKALLHPHTTDSPTEGAAPPKWKLALSLHPMSPPQVDVVKATQVKANKGLADKSTIMEYRSIDADRATDISKDCECKNDNSMCKSDKSTPATTASEGASEQETTSCLSEVGPSSPEFRAEMAKYLERKARKRRMKALKQSKHAQTYGSEGADIAHKPEDLYRKAVVCTTQKPLPPRAITNDTPQNHTEGANLLKWKQGLNLHSMNPPVSPADYRAALEKYENRKALKKAAKAGKQSKCVQAYASEGATLAPKPEDIYRATAVTTTKKSSLRWYTMDVTHAQGANPLKWKLGLSLHSKSPPAIFEMKATPWTGAKCSMEHSTMMDRECMKEPSEYKSGMSNASTAVSEGSSEQRTTGAKDRPALAKSFLRTAIQMR
jgi:hypothetical protein